MIEIVIITPASSRPRCQMRGNRDAHFSEVFYLVGVGNLARKSADY
jgi:hypothetical protein